MQIKSEALRTITQMIHAIGAPPAVTVGVCGTSLVLVAQQAAGPTIYMSVEQGIKQDCHSCSLSPRTMRIIANHAQGILDFETGFVRSQANDWEWQLPVMVHGGPPITPPEISSAFYISDRKTFYNALAAVISSGSGEAVVQNEGPNWTIVCPESWAWSVIRTDSPPAVTGQSFVIRKRWAAAILGMLQSVAASDGELLFSIADGQVVIGWYAIDRSAMVSIVIPHEQSSVEPLAENMQWLGTVDAATFHRAISALEAATAPDEAATLSMAGTLNMSTAMLQLNMPMVDGPQWWPIEVWMNTAPTRWMAGDGTIELWLSEDRLYAGSKSLTASWRKP